MPFPSLPPLAEFGEQGGDGSQDRRGAGRVGRDDLQIRHRPHLATYSHDHIITQSLSS